MTSLEQALLLIKEAGNTQDIDWKTVDALYTEITNLYKTLAH